MLFTSEQVSAGHPDKICDQIADAIVTDCLRHDRDSRVAVECMIKDCMIFIAGEITSTHAPDYEVLCREVLRRVGDPDPEAYVVNSLVTCQSRDIAMGVDRGGAGDQGLMFGYATNETPELLPLPFAVATRALELLRDRHSPLLLPDAKSQVTFDYCGRRIHTFLISAQHHAYAGQREIYELVRSVMDDVADAYGLNHDFRALVNPTGRFVRGGSYADTGVAGRKIVADTYGGVCRSGGGALSGKDPTKVDRSAAYAARWVAKNIVAAGLADRCQVQLAYAIGVAQPVSIMVDTFGTGTVSDEKLAQAVQKVFDLRPTAIIKELGLRRPIYRQLAAYGHMGREDLGVRWEITDRADQLKAACQ